MMPWQEWDQDQRWEMLSAYVDGELTEQESALVKAWLERDPEAHRMLIQLQRLQYLWSQMPYVAQAPEPVIEGVMQRLRPAPRRRRWLGTVAASMSLLAASGGLIWRWWQPQPLVSLESPPVQITLRPTATQVAETYLLTPPRTRDPFVILFQDEPLN